jgi:hypothetical protein
MPYSALGLVGGSPVDRLQASFLKRAAQRMGPAARGGRAVARAQLLSPRERMEARYARMGDRKRRAQAFDEQLAQGRDEHEIAKRWAKTGCPMPSTAAASPTDVSTSSHAELIAAVTAPPATEHATFSSCVATNPGYDRTW